MEHNNIVDILKRLRDEDETKHLKTLLEILEHYRANASPRYRELIDVELTYLANKINEAIQQKKSE